MNVKTQGASRRHSRRVPTRVVIEIEGGCVYNLVASEPCEVAIIDRDVEEMLPEGDSSYTSVWTPDIDQEAVKEAFKLADP
jgi:hypothetical protein